MSPRRKPDVSSAANGASSESSGSASSGRSARSPKSSPRSSAKASAAAERKEAESSRRDLLDAVASGLDEALGGLELLDRDLVFDEGGRADLACVDESGRLVLVILADGDANQVALVALDTVSYATRHMPLLQAHLGVSLSSAGPPRIVLLAPNGGEVLLRRIAPLCDLGLEVFGLRTMSSARGERSYLVRLGVEGEEELAQATRLDTFIDRLTAPLGEIVRPLIQRMRRLDETIELEARVRELVWRTSDRVVARLESNGRGISANVEPSGMSRTIASETDADGFLEEVMESLVGGARVIPAPRIVPSEPEPERESPRVDMDEPLLSREEIDAFR